LNSSGQWYRDSSGVLHLWDPQSDNPSGHTVEVKRRQYAFDLSGVANTTITGINIFAATINTDWSSTNTTINAINAQYISQFNNAWNSGWSPPAISGIMLNGTGSVIENSTIAFSAGDGVAVGNSNIRVTNNVIHDVDYSGTDCAGVRDGGNNTQIDNNTIYNTGRDGINFQASNVSVTSNTVHDAMLLTMDGAAIYTVNNTGGGTIAYNTIYNVTPTVNITSGLYGAAGIFLDNNSANLQVHDNVIANCDSGIALNYTSRNEQVYNNKIGGNYDAVSSNNQSAYCDWSGSQWYDNVYYNSNLAMGVNFSQWGNSFASGSPWLPPSTTSFSTPAPPPAVPVSPPPPPVSPPPAPTSPPPAPAVKAASPPPAPASPPAAANPSSPAPTSNPAGGGSTSTTAKATPPASGIPSPAPSVPASTGSAKASVVPVTMTIAAKATALISKLSKSAKAVQVSAVSNVAKELAGTVAGTYTVKPKSKDSVSGMTLSAKGSLPAFANLTFSGKSVGAISNGKATGTLELTGAKGSVLLKITAPVPSSSATPTNFDYVITSGTGTFKHVTGKGSVNLTLAPSKKGNSTGTFTLVLQPG
jgi:hypothetical protein